MSVVSPGAGRFDKAIFYLDRPLSEAVRRFNLIQQDDRVLVGLSGGKDSMVLLHALVLRQKWRKETYQVAACHVRAGAPSSAGAEHLAQMRASCHELGVRLIEVEGEPLPQPNELRRSLSPCFLCSRRRRKRLLEVAQAERFPIIALGHHKDDVAETILLNLLWQGRVDTMSPRQPLMRGAFSIIRPLVLVDEADIARAARLGGFVTTSCSCGFARQSKRETATEIIRLVRRNGCRGVTSNILRAVEEYRSDKTRPAEPATSPSAAPVSGDEAGPRPR